ncbi:hypothetical protein [Patulibacter defluvii]|uniref:hypothetical protein n=1 Tax=Patulibacter defluvii TaxID=3095358 RepID=UPI002A75AD1D|nr:hypothetical protein [Patulibacter sp. DM4]
MPGPFRSSDELREVLDRLFREMQADEALAPRLAQLRVAHELRITDADLLLQARSLPPGSPVAGEWQWPTSREQRWPVAVRFAMSADVLNRYLHGLEPLVLAVARRRIRVSGDAKAALAVIPLRERTTEIYERLVAADYPHLVG